MNTIYNELFKEKWRISSTIRNQHQTIRSVEHVKTPRFKANWVTYPLTVNWMESLLPNMCHILHAEPCETLILYNLCWIDKPKLTPRQCSDLMGAATYALNDWLKTKIPKEPDNVVKLNFRKK